MARKPTAGSLHHHAAFHKEGDTPDGHGGTVTAFTEQFRQRAQFIHMGGSETIQAARLEGRHPQVIRVRISAQTRQVTTDWMVEAVRTGDQFNIREITPTDDRMFLDFLCETGVAV